MDPKGMTFVRMMIAKALAEPGVPPEVFAAHRWGPRSAPANILSKALVAGGSSSTLPELVGLDQVAAEFLSAVAQRAVIGRMPYLRRVPENRPYVDVANSSTSYWTGEGRGAPISTLALGRDSLTAFDLITLLVFTNEILNDATPEGENQIRIDMIKACAKQADLSFIGHPNSGVSGVEPASITADAPTVTATGNLKYDLAALVETFAGDLETASFVMHPRTAVEIALSGATGLGSDIGARGGTLLGLPALTSAACEFDSSGGTIALADGAGVALVDVGIDVSKSNATSIEMSDVPTADTSSPTGASMLISMFQAELTAMKVVRHVNWKVARPGAVCCLVDCDYSA